MITPPPRLSDRLPAVETALVVIAPPDDERFGLGRAA